jgi:hypothetical protein
VFVVIKNIFSVLFLLITCVGPVSIQSTDSKAHHLEWSTVTSEFSSPTLRFFQTYPEWLIYAKHPQLKKHEALFDEMISNETDGFVGYHGGTLDYRIFQDIIRIGLEEVLGIAIPADFHFVRIPGDSGLPFDSVQEFLAANDGYFHDQDPPMMRQLLSLNISLFASYNKPWDLTPRYFFENNSWGNVDFESKLVPFFQKMGIQIERIYQMFDLGRSILQTEHGIILQFFCVSPHYEKVDRHFYAALSGGMPLEPRMPSAYLLNPSQIDFPQLRLVMNSKFALNPFSSLRIKRYDTISSEATDLFELKLREMFRSLPVNAKKKQQYFKELKKCWNGTTVLK